MPQPASPRPTELELEVLKVLWASGPSMVRQVREALAARGRDLAYTTVMTVMSIMARKRLLRRHKQGAGYVYEANVGRQGTLGRMLRDVIDRAFNGSAAAAMLHLLQTSDVDKRELEQIQKLIDSKSREARP